MYSPNAATYAARQSKQRRSRKIIAKKSEALAPLATARIDQRILIVRGERVMIDADLAELDDVVTKGLDEQVKRNAAHFPEDLMFRLTRDEVESLNRSQIATGF